MDGNETKSTIQFTPTVGDEGKKLSCTATNMNLTSSEMRDHRVTDYRIINIHCNMINEYINFIIACAHMNGTFPWINFFSFFFFAISFYLDRPIVQLSLGSSLLANNIKEGNDVYFDCRASAAPAVTRIEWFHNVSLYWNLINSPLY